MAAKKAILITAPVGNNPARVRMLIYHKGLEGDIEMKSPADYGGLVSDEYRAINPQGKMPALILPSGETLYEARVVCAYLLDVYAGIGPQIGAATPEGRARSALITQTHDLYIASPNSSNPSVTATQGCMYKGVELIDGPTRAAKVAELWKQLGVLNGLIIGPYAAGDTLTEADFALWPTLSSFLPFMLPRVFGWGNVMDDETNLPKLKAWHAAVGALPAAQRVKEEVMSALQGWEDSGRFTPIKAQMAAHPELKWKFPYRLIGKKGEGTFSEVLKAQGIKNGKYVAIKCMKNHFDSLDQVNNLREIQALRRLSPHPGIIKLCEVLYDQPTRRLALVFELMDMNIYELIRGRRQYLQEQRIKNYMYQLLKSMDHMHRNGIFHRDIKPENILITDDELKLADFGSCRGIYSKQPYTEYISTRWYRAPECLLTDGFYNYKMDMWGVGCVFFEVLSLYPLFPGTNELDQVTKIHQILGTPPPDTLAKLKKHSNSHIDFNFPHKEPQPMTKLIPHCSPDCIDIIVKLLAYDPDDRLSARQAVKHTYFKDLRANEIKEKQAAAAHGEGGNDVSDERTHAPASSTVRSSKKSMQQIDGSSGGGSMLPSIDKSHIRSHAKHSKEIPQGAGPSDDHAYAPEAAHAPQAAPSMPYVHASDYAEEGNSGTLPPIGGFAAHHGHGTSGMSQLKIDSKSLMGGSSKTQSQKAAMKRHQLKAGSMAKGPATHPPKMVGVGSSVHMQSRSCASCGDVLDFGVGNSTQHSSQPSMEADGMGLKPLSKKAAYQSPYSQRTHKKG